MTHNPKRNTTITIDKESLRHILDMTMTNILLVEEHCI